MAPPNEETMQKGHEASVGCFQGKTVIYGPYGPRCFTRYTLDTKHANNGYKKANTDSGSEGAVYEKSAVSGEYCGRPIPKENHYVWSPFSPNFLTEMNSHSLPFHGSLHPANHGRIFPANWFPHVPSQMLPHGYPIKNAFQEFQYFVVIDFEATCDKEKNPHPQEIIEFPSVLVNGVTGQLEDCFQKYVRPSHNRRLTEFCKELTGIHQSQVDGGVSLSEALLMHDKWLEEKGIKQTNFAIVTWSNWDCRVMLESECRFKRIRKPPYFNRWINLKVPFCEVFGGARCNLKEAVEMAGLTWEGRAHCGLDDAKNTARLLTHIMQRGFKFSITNTLVWQSADNPYIMHQQIPGPPEYGLGLGLAYQAHKWKKPAYMTVIPIQPAQLNRPLKEPLVRCFCGATSIKFCKHGSFFFGCGNWTATRGALCPFSKWVPPACDGAETV